MSDGPHIPQNVGWSLISSTFPYSEEFPIWAYNEDHPGTPQLLTDPETDRKFLAKYYTHWREANLVPPLPPRKPTQAELDEWAVVQAWRMKGPEYGDDKYTDIDPEFREGFYAALTHLRTTTTSVK